MGWRLTGIRDPVGWRHTNGSDAPWDSAPPKSKVLWDGAPRTPETPWDGVTPTVRTHRGTAPHQNPKSFGMAPHGRRKPRGMAPHHPLKGLLGWPPTSAGRSPVPQCEPNEPDMPANGICLRLPACLRLWSPLHIGVVRLLSTRRIPRTKIARNRPFSRRINWAIINFALQNRR